MQNVFASIGILVIGAASALAVAAPQDNIDQAFGLQPDGATLAEVREALEPHGANDGVRFAIGFVDAMLAVESTLQAAHRHGFLMTFASVAPMAGDDAQFITWFANQSPESTALRDIDAALEEGVARLNKADQTLSGVDDDFTCAIDVRQ